MSNINEISRFISGPNAKLGKNSCFRTRLMLAAQSKVKLHEKLGEKEAAALLKPVIATKNMKVNGSQFCRNFDVPLSREGVSYRLSDDTMKKIREVTQKCTSQADFDFSGLKLGHDGVSFVFASLDFKSEKISKLDFSECDLGEQGLSVVYKIVELSPSIVELNLSKNHIGQGGIHWVRKLLQDCELQVLKLSYNGLNDNDIEALFGVLAETDTLRELDLSHNLLGLMTGTIITRFLPENNSLQSLDLSHNELAADGVRNMIEGLLETRSLERLDLSWNSLNDKGMIHVAEILLRALSLKEISLNGNFITVVGAQHIAQSLRENSILEVLEIAQNFLRNEGACALLRSVRSNSSTRLTLMDLNGTVVEKEFAAMYRKILVDNSCLEITGFCVVGEDMPNLYRRKSSKIK